MGLEETTLEGGHREKDGPQRRQKEQRWEPLGPDTEQSHTNRQTVKRSKFSGAQRLSMAGRRLDQRREASCRLSVEPSSLRSAVGCRSPPPPRVFIMKALSPHWCLGP